MHAIGASKHFMPLRMREKPHGRAAEKLERSLDQIIAEWATWDETSWQSIVFTLGCSWG